MLSSDPFDIAVGERLKAVRERARLLQPDFALRIGLSPRAYANYERGERSIPAQGIKALYEEFSVDPIWLLSGPGSDPRQLPSRFDLLSEIIVKVDEHLAKKKAKLPLQKKAKLIVLLYQYFQTKGHVEDEHIEHSLAVSAL